MVGHLLSHLEPPIVAQVLRDPGGPERMATDLRGHVSSLSPPSDHPVDVSLAHGPL